MNLHDVARKAGVSIATVSRVLNGMDVVKPHTRARVLRALEALDYQPNVNARALSTGDNRTLGVIVSNLENPYFLDIFHALETEARRGGYEVLLANTDYAPDRLAAAIGLMLGRRVSGIAAIVSEMAPDLVQRLARSQTPVVVSGVAAVDPGLTNIRVNCRRGLERMLGHLRSLGHRRLAFVDHHSALESISDRRTAFQEWITGAGKATRSRIVTAGDSLEGGRQAARDLLASGSRPTAVVCVNDRMAIGVLRELRERHIAVPDEISVSGFDNISYSEYVIPALTTVHIPRETIGRLAFSCLAGSGDSASREIVIEPELIVRESTGPAKRR